MTLDEAGGKLGVADRGGAHGHPGGPGAQRPGDGLRRTQSPAELDADPAERLGDDGGGEIELSRLPCPRPVEVHDVDPRRPGIGELARDLARVCAVGGLAAEVTLAQADHPPAAEVDRRQQLEG